MPRLQSSQPRYRLHKASGRAVVSLSGKDVYLGTFGSQQSRAEYDRIVAEWLANGRRLPGSDSNSVASQSLAVVELAAAYLQYAKVYYRKNGQPTSSLIRVRVAIKLLKQLYGRETIASFGRMASS